MVTVRHLILLLSLGLLGMSSSGSAGPAPAVSPNRATASLFAQEQQPDAMRLWLGKASEHGYDVRRGMQENAVFRPWLKDPQILIMLGNTAKIGKGPVPSLGEQDIAKPNGVN